MHEMYQAVIRLKSGKAPGPDGTTAELFKLLNDDVLELVRLNINDIWYNEALPPEMHQANLAVIYKKGPTQDPANYRPIALLNLSYKILAIIIHTRLSQAIDININPHQFGFRKGKSTSQPLFIYRRIQELHEESGDTFHTLLLDWEKAFDKVDQTRLVQALSRLGIPPKILRLITAIYDNPKFTVTEGEHNSTERKQNAGIRQGCPLSPYLFILLPYNHHTRRKYKPHFTTRTHPRKRETPRDKHRRALLCGRYTHYG